jgi:hypothetical protein
MVIRKSAASGGSAGMATGSDSPGSDESGVAVLPSLDLPIEKGAPCRVIRERSQVAIEPREETPCPVGGLPGAVIGNARVAINRMVMAAPDLPFEPSRLLHVAVDLWNAPKCLPEDSYTK